MRSRSQRLVGPVVVAVIAVVAATAGSARAQEQYVQQVRRQLDASKIVAERAGYEKTHDYKIKSLSSGRSDTFTVTLRKGWEYALLSACDNDCSDIDIKVFDENGNSVAEDKAVDALPVVEVQPKWTGEFRIKVTMYRCNDDPCYFGIGVFGK